MYENSTSLVYEYARCSSLWGFTLVELVVTLTVAAILVTMAVPSFTTMIKDNRQSTQLNDLITTLIFARSEAINRNARITVCKSADGASCAGSNGWDQGWIAFVDSNNDAAVSAGETILRVHGALSSTTTINGSTNVASYISYVSQGSSQLTSGSVQSGTLVECDDRGSGSSAKTISLSATGRASSSSGAASCSP